MTFLDTKRRSRFFYSLRRKRRIIEGKKKKGEWRMKDPETENPALESMNQFMTRAREGEDPKVLLGEPDETWMAMKKVAKGTKKNVLFEIEEMFQEEYDHIEDITEELEEMDKISEEDMEEISLSLSLAEDELFVQGLMVEEFKEKCKCFKDDWVDEKIMIKTMDEVVKMYEEERWMSRRRHDPILFGKFILKRCIKLGFIRRTNSPELSFGLKDDSFIEFDSERSTESSVADLFLKF